MKYDAEYWQTKHDDLRRAVDTWLDSTEAAEHDHDDLDADPDCTACQRDALETLIAIYAKPPGVSMPEATRPADGLTALVPGTGEGEPPNPIEGRTGVLTEGWSGAYPTTQWPSEGERG